MHHMTVRAAVLSVRSIRLLASVLVAVLCTTLVQVVPTPVAAAPRRLQPQVDAKVPVRDVALTPYAADPAEAAATRRAPAAVWPTPGEAVVELPAAGTAVAAGGLPVRIGAAGATRSDAVTRARVEVLDGGKTARGARPEVLLRLGRADGVATSAALTVAVDYSGFRSAFGGDFGNRLRLVALPECALFTPDSPECHGTPVRSSNDGSVLVAEAAVGDSSEPAALLAVQAGPAGSTGDFKATDLATSGKWEAGGSSGDFSWSYPLRVPPGLNGPTPSLALSYSAQSVDGRTAASNNQPSWAGEGFNLGVGYVERSYRSCSDDMGNGANNTTASGDQCWATDNATLSLNGRTVELIRDSSGRFRPKTEDGSRIEHLFGGGDNDVDRDDNGEYWRVTTVDGVQYWFGRNRLPGWASGKAETNSVWTVPVYGNHVNEPCHAATFAGSSCSQAWRWNLDYVVDTHGNSMSLWYQKERNQYAREANATKLGRYVRSGWLERIDYGTRTDAEFGTAPMQVLLNPADRCLANCATRNATNWPDTPWDLECTASPCRTGSPTFWSAKRLSSVSTRVWVDGAYQQVESWTLTHSFPDPGDNTRAGLWLASIGNTGHVGGDLATEAVSFTGTQLANRVDSPPDQLPPMNWWRLSSIRNETGGEISIGYAGQQCVAGTAMPAPHDNKVRCFPVLWTPTGWADPKQDWFHKHVVSQVTENDHIGGATLVDNRYEYLGDPAWHYADDDGLALDKYKTWSDYRGYGKVRVTKGKPGEEVVAETRYFRGMDGDKQPVGTRKAEVEDSLHVKLPDTEALAGFVREETNFNGGSPYETVINDPWLSNPTATRTAGGSTVVARYSGIEASHLRTTLDADRGVRVVTKATTFDDYGMPVKVNDLGDEATTADDQCTITTYSRNTSLWFMSAVSRTQLHAVACGTTPTQAQVLADTEFWFDGQGRGVAPTTGNLTQTRSITGWANGQPDYQTVSQTAFDAYGRAVETVDVKGNRATNRFSPAAGAAPTSLTTTDPNGNTAVTEYAPAWGSMTAAVDANGNRTDLRYDPLGKLTGVWYPGRGRNESANLAYEYRISRSGTWVKSTELTANGGTRSAYAIYDGLLRPRQTQSPSPAANARIITDTVYDSAGRPFKSNAKYASAGNPSGTIVNPDEGAIPAQTLTLYDGASRPRAQIYKSLGAEQWRTVNAYAGDRVDTTPPAGGTATSTLLDGRGRRTELRQYQGGKPTGEFDVTKYTYRTEEQPATVVDPAGNQWTWEYDLRGRKVRSVDPDRGTTKFTYNDYDELTSTTDARGRTLTYTYDKIGRKTSVTEGGTKLTEWTYDSATGGKGQLASSTRWVGGQPYTTTVAGYTARGLPQGIRITIPSNERALAGTYDFATTYKPDGSVSTVTSPGAGDQPTLETVGFDYDALGLPKALKRGTGDTFVENAAYTTLGELGVLTMARSATSRYVEIGNTYQVGTRRLIRQEVVREAAVSPVADIAYGYDDAGNITRIADTPAGGAADIQCFTQDYLRRMTAAWTPGSGNCATAPTTGGLGGAAPYWQSWTYDKVGNRTGQVEHRGSGDITTNYKAEGSQPHAVTGRTVAAAGIATTTGYTYDAAGNLLTRPIGGDQQTLSWDSEGNLASVADATGTTSYLYDADGARLIRRDTTGTTLYLPGMELRLTTNTNTVMCRRYYSFAGLTVAERTAAATTWLIPDHQGTADISIDTTPNQTVTRRRHLPFGEPRGGASAWANELGFVGGINDPTGTVHLGAREYDPAIGRFTSVDPVLDPTDPQQMHGYAYANNSPVSYSDANGMRSCGPDGVLCGYDSALGTRAQYQRERFVYRVLQPLRRALKQIAKKLRGVNERKLKNGHSFTTVSHKGRISYFVDNVKIPAQLIDDPLEFAIQYDAAHDDEYGSKITDPITRSLRALAIACDTGKPGCSLSYRQGLAGEMASHVAEKYYGCDQSCQQRNDVLLNIFLMGAQALRKGTRSGIAELEMIRCGNSFDPDTPVLMADGTTKLIKDLKPGEQVTATDPYTGGTVAKPVVATIVGTGDKQLVKLTVDIDGAHGDATGTVVATDHHPFWLPQPGNWLDAADIAPGQVLRTASGSQVRVVKVDTWTVPTTVVNLTIADIHTYYVLAGTTPVLVHNCGGVSFSPGQLQKKFKHASDFDVQGNYNLANRQKFQDALESHIRDVETIELHGYYHNNPARFYYNLQTRNALIVDMDGNFVSGWKLSPGQSDNLLGRGRLGGG
jgi:RHS repeat-associated protein